MTKAGGRDDVVVDDDDDDNELDEEEVEDKANANEDDSGLRGMWLT